MIWTVPKHFRNRTVILTYDLKYQNISTGATWTSKQNWNMMKFLEKEAIYNISKGEPICSRILPSKARVLEFGNLIPSKKKKETFEVS